ncbi:MAG: DNA gyrase subunit A, partial [Papillibacter sp.]|nr:DNA gyrase subunit A [Papillibacter sp.]
FFTGSTYKNQRRGGKGIFAMATREEDYVETIFTASTHDNILFFTNFGRVYRKKGYIIPEAGRTAKGTNIINILPIEQGEQVNAMIHIREFPQDKYLVMVTKTGTVKRMSFSELRNMKNVGIRAIKLDDGDELISVRETDGNQNIIIATHDGMAICFKETDVRPMGRAAAGVRGILLREGDFCVGAARCREGGCLLTVTENGYGKKTPINEYLRSGEEPQKRGGIGIKNYQVTEKTGKVAAVKVVDDNDDVLIISSDGVIIRMAAADINIYGRATQGVRVMRLDEGIKVISLARTEKETEEEAE